MPQKKNYTGMSCEPVPMNCNAPILAGSVIEDSTVSSTGQEIGTEATFTEADFVNLNWESGTE